MSLAAGTTLSPLEILAQTNSPDYYPPALTGMRGSHAGSFEVAHAVSWAGQAFTRPKAQTENIYDLVVVGGGISGLSAAKFYRDRNDGDANILVLDNHDDFGGHAKRNEFNVDGKKLLGYGGSQTLDGPAKYSKVAKQLLGDLSIDVQRFYDYYDQAYFDRRGMGSGIYFDQDTYGTNRLMVNPIGGLLGEVPSPELLRSSVRSMPISEAGQDALLEILTSEKDYLAGKSLEEKILELRDISYFDFLRRYTSATDDLLGVLQDTLLPLIAVGWEAGSAWYAAEYLLPGTWHLGVQPGESDSEPYIFHFPDGNASIARALVRDLLPNAIPGSSMEDLVTARADYAELDRAGSPVRIRLNSTAVNVAHSADQGFVDVTYVNGGEVYRVRGKHVVMACYNSIIPHICDELPDSQVEAIQFATKVPFVIGNFAIRNWRAFADAGFHTIYSPGDVYFKFMPLDFPVSMGDYHYSKGPDEPIIVSAWYSPTERGLPAREQYKAGRRKLYELSYADFENDIVGHLDGMLGTYGFDAERDIAAITLNRWSHGYAYEFEEVGSPPEWGRDNGPHIAGRAQIGRISIANSDSEAYAYVDGAIDAADRAVNEQISG